jgi:hypothetical protein
VSDEAKHACVAATIAAGKKRAWRNSLSHGQSNTMAAAIKTKLKAARDAIGRRDYLAARQSASSVLDMDAQNYNACVVFDLFAYV